MASLCTQENSPSVNHGFESMISLTWDRLKDKLYYEHNLLEKASKLQLTGFILYIDDYYFSYKQRLINLD